MAGYSNYRTPIEGLFMTGAATWPGGGVTGLPGHLAAKAVLAGGRLPGRLGALTRAFRP
jgi:phytoene dehydrogenase-like protein